MKSLRTVSRLSSVRTRTRKPWHCARGIHQLKLPSYDVEDGLGDFLPPSALKTVALDYQQGLLDRLNDEVRGTEDENKTVVQTVINTAGNRSKTMAFNYASLALNNSFFLEMLKRPEPPATSHERGITGFLGGAIRSQHGSLEQLKSNFCATALGMASSGFVWFVADRKGNTGVIPTFGAGTLLVRSRKNVLPVDGDQVMNNTSTTSGSTATSMSVFSGPTSFPTSGLSHSPTPPNSPNFSRYFYNDSLTSPASSIYSSEPYPQTQTSGRDDFTLVGEELRPLFCVSVHEHAWMSAGYGVWGKEEWLKKFWTVLNWEKVSQSFAKHFPDQQTF